MWATFDLHSWNKGRAYQPKMAYTCQCINAHWFADPFEASLSIDILLGWDLTDPKVQNFTLAALRARRVRFVMLSPPCTTFSSIRRMNMHHMDPVKNKVPNFSSTNPHCIERAWLWGGGATLGGCEA